MIRKFQPVTAKDLTAIMGVRATQIHSALQNLLDLQWIESVASDEGKLYKVRLHSGLPLLQQLWTAVFPKNESNMESDDDNECPCPN